MNIYSIYKITCLVNLKVYIGFTSQDVNARFKEHLKESKKTHDLRKFYCAIRKHGSSNFVYETIYQSCDKVYTHEVMEDYFINLYDSLKQGYNSVKGGHGHITRGRTKSVDLYGPGNIFIHTFPTLKSCAEHLNTNPAIISSACKNATLNKGSQVKGHWVCYSGCEPVYKVPNTKAGCEAARKKNTGQTRPMHSKHIKDLARIRNKKIHIPEGWYILTDATQFYGIDMLREWCYNPDKIITKMMISKSKHFNDYSLVGRTRREAGFYSEDA